MSVTIGGINRYGRAGVALITNLEITSQPATDAVSSSDVLEWLRIDSGDTSQASVIALLTKSAITDVQIYGNVSLITQTRRVTYGQGKIAYLPNGPVITVTSVESQNTDGVWTATTEFTFRGSGLIEFDTEGTYRVTYTAGFGAAATNVPDTYRMAILEHIKEHYEIRMGIALGLTSETIDGMGWKAKIQPVKQYAL